MKGWSEFFFMNDLSLGKILGLFVLFLVGYIFLVSRTALPNIRSAPGWPILRQIPTIWQQPNLSVLFSRWFDASRDEGLFRYFNFAGPERLVVFKGEYIKQILVSKSLKFHRVDDIKKALPSLGNGILTAHGYDHAWQRKLLNPLFSYSAIKEYTGAFDKHTWNLVKLWKEKCNVNSTGTAEFQVQDDLHRFTLDIIGETALGYDFNSLLNEDNEISRAFVVILTTKFLMSYRLLRFLIPFYEHLPFPSNVRLWKAQRLTNAVADEVIRSKREKYNACCFEEDGQAMDLLSVMMRAREEDSGKQMTDDILKQNAFTFLLAGHETTSVALSWTLYHLARNPRVQEKARKEAQNVLGNGKIITTEVTTDLEYIGMVVKESLRLSPPASFLPRRNISPENFGDSLVPAGTFLLIPVIGVHTYHKFWSRPDEFLPERFKNTDDVKSSGINGQTYLPFGSGPRNCIGAKFATLEMKVALARLLTEFRFSMRPDHPAVKGKFLFTLKPVPTPTLVVSVIKDEHSEPT